MNNVLHPSSGFSDWTTLLPAKTCDTWCLASYLGFPSCNPTLVVADLPLHHVVSMLITHSWLCWLFCFCNARWLPQCSLKPVPACISLSQIVQPCFCFVAKVIPEGVVCSHSPPSLYWFTFMPGTCLSSVAVWWGAQQPYVKPTVVLFWGICCGGTFLFVCFSPELERRGVSLYSSEWSFVFCWGNEKLKSCLAWHRNVPFHRSEIFGLESMRW